ncbi:unnamed protein product [Amoebophrya sp. A25]|nr:unnamed protein product [Amoebophrya sp. A25]|eukprot:GSA25T00011469001.1
MTTSSCIGRTPRVLVWGALAFSVLRLLQGLFSASPEQDLVAQLFGVHSSGTAGDGQGHTAGKDPSAAAAAPSSVRTSSNSNSDSSSSSELFSSASTSHSLAETSSKSSLASTTYSSSSRSRSPDNNGSEPTSALSSSSSASSASLASAKSTALDGTPSSSTSDSKTRESQRPLDLSSGETARIEPSSSALGDVPKAAVDKGALRPWFARPEDSVRDEISNVPAGGDGAGESSLVGTNPALPVETSGATASSKDFYSSRTSGSAGGPLLSPTRVSLRNRSPQTWSKGNMRYPIQNYRGSKSLGSLPSSSSFALATGTTSSSFSRTSSARPASSNPSTGSSSLAATQTTEAQVMKQGVSEVQYDAGSGSSVPVEAADAGDPTHNSREAAFEKIYQTGAWFGGGSGSGPGSRVDATVGLRRHLHSYITRNNIDIMFDVPCGAMEWTAVFLKEVWKTRPNFQYIGVDIARIPLSRARLRFQSTETRVQLLRADLSLSEPANTRTMRRLGAALLKAEKNIQMNNVPDVAASLAELEPETKREVLGDSATTRDAKSRLSQDVGSNKADAVESSAVATSRNSTLSSSTTKEREVASASSTPSTTASSNDVSTSLAKTDVGHDTTAPKIIALTRDALQHLSLQAACQFIRNIRDMTVQKNHVLDTWLIGHYPGGQNSPSAIDGGLIDNNMDRWPYRLGHPETVLKESGYLPSDAPTKHLAVFRPWQKWRDTTFEACGSVESAASSNYPSSYRR